jgi:purine catabolism regulator
VATPRLTDAPAGAAAPARDAVTVAEAVRALLPAGRLRGGAAGLTRRVTWATSLRSRPPAFEPHGGGELVLTGGATLESLLQVDASLSLVRILEGLSAAGAAALCVATPVNRAASKVADALGLPLIELPPATSLVDAERGIIGLILGRHNELQAQASDFYRHLAQLAVENRGLEAIIRQAASASGRVVAFEDARFHLRSAATPSGVTPPPLDGAGLSSADERGRLGEALRGQPVSVMTPTATFLPAARWGMVRYAAPVVTRERVRGFVSFCQDTAETGLTEFDQLAASRTASVLAIELAKEDAVQAAEQRIQGDLVDELLHPSDAEGAGRRAVQAGLAPEGTFAVLALTLANRPDGHAGVNLVSPASATAAVQAGATALADGVSRHFRRTGRPALVRLDGDELLVICQLAPADEAGRSGAPTPGAPPPGAPPGVPDAAAVEALLKTIAGGLQTALKTLGFGAFAAGYSRPHRPIGAVSQAAREAREALRIGRQVYGDGQLVAFGDLGLYRVLHALRDSAELRTFYEQTLGRVVEYDRRTGQNWIETLEEYFACHGNLSQAAQRLQLHRNALIYRIRRIEEVGGVDLEDPECRLSLQVALKARKLLT